MDDYQENPWKEELLGWRMSGDCRIVSVCSVVKMSVMRLRSNNPTVAVIGRLNVCLIFFETERAGEFLGGRSTEAFKVDIVARWQARIFRKGLTLCLAIFLQHLFLAGLPVRISSHVKLADRLSGYPYVYLYLLCFVS